MTIRLLPLTVLVPLLLTGCFCRQGTIDCTTGRAYPAFCKPLSGGCDPSVWFCDKCPHDCATTVCGAYTPYGGNLHHGEPTQFVPACAGRPLAYAPAAVPARPDFIAPNTPFSGGYVPVPAPWPPCPEPGGQPRIGVPVPSPTATPPLPAPAAE